MSGRVDARPQYPTLPKHETPRFYGLARRVERRVGRLLLAGDRAADERERLDGERAADGGSFSRAARELGLSQPSVSRIVSELEARLGVKLLLRTTRRVTPTEAGNVLLEQARQILVDLDDAENATRGVDSLRGTLRIAMSGSFGTREVIPHLSAFLGTMHTFGSISSNLIATRISSPKGSTSRCDWVRWRGLPWGSASAWAELRAWRWRRRLTWRVEAHRKPLPSYRATIASWVLVSRVEPGGASLRLAR